VLLPKVHPRTGHNRASVADRRPPFASGRTAYTHENTPNTGRYRRQPTSVSSPAESRASTVAETGQHPRLSGCFRRTRDLRCRATGAVASASMTGGLEDPRKQAFSRACCRRSRFAEGTFQLDDGIAATATSEPRTHCGAEHECYRPNTGVNSGFVGVPCQPVCVTRRAPVGRHDPTRSQPVTIEPEGTRGDRAIAHSVDGSRSGGAVLNANAISST